VLKNRYVTALIIAGAAVFGGIIVLLAKPGNPAGAANPGAIAAGNQNPSSSARKIAYWWDPMLGPSSISDHPGKSAMGMDLVPVFADEVSAGPSVRIDPTVVQNMGVTTSPVVRGDLTVTVRSVGVLRVPEPSLHDVTLKIGGFIDRLEADTEGMTVHKGDMLFDLYSPDLQVAEQELISAEQNLNALDAKAADAAREEAQNLVDSAKQKLRLWDIAERDIENLAGAPQAPRTLPIRSPADGVIVDKAVVEGSAVAAGMKVMRIEDHSHLWLEAVVYEQQIPLVKIGQEVRATVDGVPGKTFEGKVIFVNPRVDAASRTETVRALLDNPDRQLTPGMYASVEIATRPEADAIFVPREAVIDTGTQQIAFVQDPASPGRFQPRNVRVGIAGDQDRLQIVQGLAPGDQVVTSGQFLMDVESRTTEAIDKLRSGSRGNSVESGSTTQGNAPLVLAHCSMRNADWIQVGNAIVNPYLGSSMSTCGEVVRQFDPPPRGSATEAILLAYLKVAVGLDHDAVDAAAVAELSKQTAAAGSPISEALRSGVAHLGAAKDLVSARAAFQEISPALATQLENTTP
jgi:RND family efflux transporter MFP subunit